MDPMKARPRVFEQGDVVVAVLPGVEDHRDVANARRVP
jgi:hypothetical protein